MNIQDKKVLVIGSGISGIGAVGLLNSLHAMPVLFDADRQLNAEDLLAKIKKETGAQPDIYIGDIPEDVKAQIELVVPSPGVASDVGMVAWFRDRNVPIWGEIELAYMASKGKLAAITGTNGKTTTTSLVGEILKEQYKDVYVVGNIGNPYTVEALKMTDETVTVAEVSSFQLETVVNFHPNVSAILNVTPDHLNRHHTMANYVMAKEAVAMNQTGEDVCVLNYDNEYTKEFGERCGARVVYFSSETELEDGFFLKDDYICMAKDGKVSKLLNIHRDMNLVGICNVENVMAAIAVGIGMGVAMDKILKAVKAFKAVEHRIEYVATKGGVDYYNDSKGTNPDAAIQGIKAMSKPTILIGGGYDKQNEYDEWIEAFGDKVKLLVLIGQTRKKIAHCALKHGFSKYVFAETFVEAMDICVQNAHRGDAVLLSPACASWGMFPNYEVRGQMFKDYVNNLKE